METHSYADMDALHERNWWYVARRELIRRLIERFCPNAETVVDIGCGVGSNAEALVKPGRRVIGVDASAEALARCRARGVYAETVHVATEHIPLSDASADLVIAADVLEHIDDERALAEIHRLLKPATAGKPGGTLLITVPAHRWLWNWNDDYSHHLRRYANGELERKLRAHGFRLQKSSAWNLTMTLPVFAVSLLQRFQKKPSTLENNLRSVPSWLNAIVLTLMRWENAIVLRAGLPFGVSRILVAKKG